MNLYLVRHGEAEPSEGARTDADRNLTSEGRKHLCRIAKGLASLGCRPERVASSPFRRGVETAKILAQVVAPKAPVETYPFLAPGAVATEVAGWLRETEQDNVMVIGHAPDMEEIASDFVCQDSRMAMKISKGGVCLITFDAPPTLGGGRLEWLLPPRVFG